MRRLPRLTARIAALVAAVAVAVCLVCLLCTSIASAQVPTQTPPPARTPSDAQQLAVERQLLCPQCVNERLDVCALAICLDMKRQIREQLAAGRNSDDIILFFVTRFGPKVRADLPREGFNLVLFGWVGGAIVLSGLAAAYALYTMRRDSQRRGARRRAAVAAPADDRWVADLLDEAPGRDDAGGAR